MPRSEPDRLVELDGLRGLACLTVVLFHYVFLLVPDTSTGLGRYSARLLGLGWIGVDIGTVATKLAQIERVGDSLQLTAHWIIDSYSGDPLTKDSLQSRGCFPFQSQLQEARSLLL